MKIIVGPPGSGKTSELIRLVRERCGNGLGKRVWWVGLPHQRPHVMRRLTAGSPVSAGVEFMTSQQLYMRLLSVNGVAAPPLPNTERVALVGLALSLSGGQPVPGPGESRLYASAIAEAKRHNLGPGEVDGADITIPDGYREVFGGVLRAGEESSSFPASPRRLREVFKRYEVIKHGLGKFDYDDYRIHAHHLLSTREDPRVEPDVVVVDGFRAFTRLELSIFQALARHCEVVLACNRLPAGFEATERLPAREAGVVAHGADNPIDELRFVLRSVKRDLAGGLDPLDVAVIAPERDHAFIETLAREYGIPLMPAGALSLARTAPGGLLVDLLTYVDAPNPAKLERLPGLRDAAIATRREGLTGLAGVEYMAARLGVLDTYREWVARLEAPEGSREDRELVYRWAASLVDALPSIDPAACGEGWETYRELMLLRAREATHLGFGGAHYRRWLVSLVRETSVPTIRNGGVALLTANQASGVQFRRAYVTHATVGAYTLNEREDFFISEDERVDDPTRGFFLPRHFQGMDDVLYAELRTRAPETVITFSSKDQNAQYQQEALITGPKEGLQPLPLLPAGSPVELLGYQPYQASDEFPPGYVPRTVQALRSFMDCPVRYWADRHLRDEDDADWWRAAVRALTQHKGKITREALDQVKAEHPVLADWVDEYARQLLSYRFGVRIPKAPAPGQVVAVVDAARFESGGAVTLVHFTAPGRVNNDSEANDRIYDRWNELYAAGVLLERNASTVKSVKILAWPVGGAPYRAYTFNSFTGQAEAKLAAVRSAQEALSAEAPRFVPKPGYHCNECRHATLCRKDAHR